MGESIYKPDPVYNAEDQVSELISENEALRDQNAKLNRQNVRLIAHVVLISARAAGFKSAYGQNLKTLAQAMAARDSWESDAERYARNAEYWNKIASNEREIIEGIRTAARTERRTLRDAVGDYLPADQRWSSAELYNVVREMRQKILDLETQLDTSTESLEGGLYE